MSHVPANYFCRSLLGSEVSTFSADLTLNKFLDDRHCFTLSVEQTENGFSFSEEVSLFGLPMMLMLLDVFVYTVPNIN